MSFWPKSLIQSKPFIAVAIIVIMIGSGLAYFFISSDNNSSSVDPFSTPVRSEFVDNSEIDATLDFAIDNIAFYKGENIPFALNLEILKSKVFIQSLTIRATDLVLNRSAEQSFPLDLDLEPGQYSYDFQLKPGFSENGLVTLGYNTYSLDYFNVTYFSTLKSETLQKPLNVTLEGNHYPTTNELMTNVWNTLDSENVTIDARGDTINFAALQINATPAVSTFVNLTGNPRLDYEFVGLKNSIVNILLNGSLLESIKDKTFGNLSVGLYLGIYNLTIQPQIVQQENISIKLVLPNQHIPIFVVIANNNWDGEAEDGYVFREPEFYLDQVTERFKTIFNVSFYVVAQVDFETDKSSSYTVLRVDAIDAVGQELKLRNNKWSLDLRTNSSNAGADLMIVLTDKTMDYLGIVFGTPLGRYNMAFHARGSLNTGTGGDNEELDAEIRLPPSFADNLIQHEMSHIFGAIDRFTDTDNPSIMTKSRLDDALIDLIAGRFWLGLTYWLEDDIDLMVNEFARYD